MVMRALVALMAVRVNVVAGEKPVLSIHGSGTTNPSKCYWHVMDKMEARAKLPMHMTYRGIGSSGGQTEFNTTPPVTYFGSGDIPIKEELYDYLSANEVIFQMPVFVGAVSFFHSVPNTPTLNLTACQDYETRYYRMGTSRHQIHQPRTQCTQWRIGHSCGSSYRWIQFYFRDFRCK
jgi:ABC-type phosphate transport system substrate-binding protein